MHHVFARKLGFTLILDGLPNMRLSLLPTSQHRFASSNLRDSLPFTKPPPLAPTSGLLHGVTAPAPHTNTKTPKGSVKAGNLGSGGEVGMVLQEGEHSHHPS